MKVPIRKTIVGTEYWDTKKKQSLFVRRESEPNFEVTENPKSMIASEEDKIEVIRADQIISGLINQEVVKDDSDDEDILVDNNKLDSEETQLSSLDSMNVKELRAYAKRNSIKIPAAIRTKGDILQIIQESE